MKYKFKVLSTKQQVALVIIVVKQVYQGKVWTPSWIQWADKWLSGVDQSSNAAYKISHLVMGRDAPYYATCAAEQFGLATEMALLAEYKGGDMYCRSEESTAYKREAAKSAKAAYRAINRLKVRSLDWDAMFEHAYLAAGGGSEGVKKSSR